MLLEEIVPEYDFGEVHSTRLSAPPEDALGAITLVELGEMPLVLLLFAVRSIPAYMAGKGVCHPMLWNPSTGRCWNSVSCPSPRIPAGNWSSVA